MPSIEPSALREEIFEHGKHHFRIHLPASPEDLIDDSADNVDERLPYWADLWPSARALSRHLLDRGDLPEHAIEIGCGVALPSICLASRGVRMLATDWYDDALRFVLLNAGANGVEGIETREVDWRAIPVDIPPAELVIAADVLYEQRNIEGVKAAAEGLVATGGRLLLADPGRNYLQGFVQLMEAGGWAVVDQKRREERTDGGLVHQIEIMEFRRKEEGGNCPVDMESD